MKKFTFILLLSWASVSLFAQQNGYSNYYYTLEDGDSIVTDGVISEFYNKSLPDMTQQLPEGVLETVQSSVVLRALMSDAEQSTLSSDIVDYFQSVYNCEFPWFMSREFVLNLFRNRRIRDHLFQLVTDVILQACRALPRDYRDNLVYNFASMLQTTREMMNHQYSVRIEREVYSNDVYEYPILMKDGRDADCSHDMEGFIARRVLFDNFTLAEIEQRLETLLDTLLPAETLDSDHGVCINLNFELQYFVTPHGQYFYFPETKRYLSWAGITCRVPKKNECFGDEATIFYYGNSNESYYRIVNGSWSESNGAYATRYSKFATVVDSKGNVLAWESPVQLHVDESCFEDETMSWSVENTSGENVTNDDAATFKSKVLEVLNR